MPGRDVIAVTLCIVAMALIARALINKLELYIKLNEENKITVRRMDEKLKDMGELIRTLRTSVSLEERNRIAARIHDEVGHGISGSIILLEAALLVIKEDSQKAGDSIAKAIRNLRECVDDIRAALREERTDRYRLGIHDLAAILEEFKVSYNKSVKLKTSGELKNIAPDIELIESAEGGQQAVDLCLKHKPDLALLDIRMPDMDGIDAAVKIMAEEAAKPLLLTTFDEPELIVRALKAGVSGYILKNSPAERILSAIRVIYSGGTVFQKDILDFIRGRISSGSPGRKLMEMMLSPRELEIARLIAEGLSNKDIGERLYLSQGTVRNHISTILEKTGLEHRTQIAVHYLTNT